MESSKQPATNTADRRLDQARTWMQSVGVEIQSEFHDVAGDASFRRYFRLQADGQSAILMDAPPPTEDVRPFVDVANRLRAAGLHAPDILRADMDKGFLLLEDLGDDLYRDFLDQQNVDDHFPALFQVLRSMALLVDASGLPKYDARLLQLEMDLFPDWYLGHHRINVPRREFDLLWDGFCNRIIQEVLNQPSGFVHRDFHSCNLMTAPSGEVGVIDFQDAVSGPVSYDFASLIWDRYITWPRPQVERWMEQYRQLLGITAHTRDWQRCCDLMGLQRNIKVVGIFARLYYRDKKTGYLEMIPRFYDYITDTLSRYPEFAELLALLEQPECAP